MTPYPSSPPMAEALAEHMDKASTLREYTDLPAVMTDLLLEHPKIASLFQRALQGDSNAVGNQLMNSWLENFVYRADMTWWIFAGTVLLVIVLTLLTTAYERYFKKLDALMLLFQCQITI